MLYLMVSKGPSVHQTFMNRTQATLLHISRVYMRNFTHDVNPESKLGPKVHDVSFSYVLVAKRLSGSGIFEKGLKLFNSIGAQFEPYQNRDIRISSDTPLAFSPH